MKRTIRILQSIEGGRFIDTITIDNKQYRIIIEYNQFLLEIFFKLVEIDIGLQIAYRFLENSPINLLDGYFFNKFSLTYDPQDKTLLFTDEI